MQCKFVKENLPFYYYNELDKEIISGIKFHMKSCKNCRREFEHLKRTLKLVNKGEELKLSLAYRRTLVNKILEVTNLKEERGFLQRRRVIAFSSSFAIALILFFSFLASFRIHDASLYWQDDSFTYTSEELNNKITDTLDMISEKTVQSSGYVLDEKIESVSGEMEELMVFFSI